MGATPEKNPPVVLTIAGFDPTSGAGVVADLKTLAAHGCYGVAALTSLAIQNTEKVHAVEPLPPETLQRQLDAVLSDMTVAAVKVGMVASRKNISIIAVAIRERKLPNVVVDPVLRSTSGTNLLEGDALQALREELLGLATVVTPNLWEARILAGVDIKGKEDIREAARRIQESGAKNVVITGGELDPPTDLFFNGEKFEEYSAERIRSDNTHGTGCAYSSAVAANLACGRQLPDAIVMAKAYVSKAIQNGYGLGKGKGLLNHFFRRQGESSSGSRSAASEGGARTSHF